jgi:hypothetical protein
LVSSLAVAGVIASVPVALVGCGDSQDAVVPEIKADKDTVKNEILFPGSGADVAAEASKDKMKMAPKLGGGAPAGDAAAPAK